MGFGETMKEARMAKGLSRRDVRLMTGVVESELRAFEEGMRSPSPAEQALIEDALDIGIGRRGETEER